MLAESTGVEAGSETRLKIHRDNLKSGRSAPNATTCQKCSKLGDLIIAANSPVNAEIHTLDKAFEAWGKCYRRVKPERAVVVFVDEISSQI